MRRSGPFSGLNVELFLCTLPPKKDKLDDIHTSADESLVYADVLRSLNMNPIGVGAILGCGDGQISSMYPCRAFQGNVLLGAVHES